MVINRQQAAPRRYILFIGGRCECGGLLLQFTSPVSERINLRVIEENSSRIPEILARPDVPRHSAGLCGRTTVLNRIRPKRKLRDQWQEPSKI